MLECLVYIPVKIAACFWITREKEQQGAGQEGFSIREKKICADEVIAVTTVVTERC